MLRELRSKGNTLFQSREFAAAARVYQNGYAEATRVRDQASALRFLINLGGARFAVFDYRGALQAYTDARRLARQLGDSEMAAVVSGNLSSLYLQQQEFNAAARSAEEALTALRLAGPTKTGPLLRAQCAILHSREGRFDLALALFRQALAEVDVAGDTAALSSIWDQLGYELLSHGLLDDAERALLEAFRLRKLNRLEDVRYSYYTLGMLRLAQGDASSAERLLDQSIAGLQKGTGTLALWRAYFERGRARMRSGRATAALADFKDALELAGRLRLELLPAESVWVSTGVDKSRLCTELIRAASELYFRTGDPTYAQLGLAVLEENRASGLRALIQTPDEWRKRLPQEYWEVLARYRSSEAALLRAENLSPESELSRLRYRLTEMEAEAGLHLEPSTTQVSGSESQLVQRLRHALRQDESFFSFHLDDPYSLLWAVSRDECHVVRLPPRQAIESLVREFKEEVLLGQPQADLAGDRLFRALFSSAPRSLLSNRRWTLALDGGLYQLPVAALVVARRGGRSEYLAERHSLRTVPSAVMLSGKQGAPAWEGPFVGVGDPIYNAADPRPALGKDDLLQEHHGFLDMLPLVLAATRPGQGLQLPRLPGSSREIEACSKAWRPSAARPALLTGPHAAIREVKEALGRNPSVLHFATHFLKSASDPQQALIALSLAPGGAPELLSPAEISRVRLTGGLVVLSGCASAGAQTLPAEGLMGMTRAWLGAGANSVLATLWPTPDDQGRLLVAFYSHLSELRATGGDWAVGDALRMAQLDMLHSGTWHQSPRYWGAYILAEGE